MVQNNINYKQLKKINETADKQRKEAAQEQEERLKRARFNTAIRKLTDTDRDSIKSATFSKRWIESGLLPFFIAEILTAIMMFYNSAVTDVKDKAESDYQEKFEHVQELRRIAHEKYENKDSTLDAANIEYNKAYKELNKKELKKYLDARNKADKVRRIEYLMLALTGYALFFAGMRAALEKEDRPTKKYDVDRIVKLFNDYQTAGTGFELDEKIKEIEELGKVGTKILKKLSYQDYYVENVDKFNFENQVVILQQWLKMHPKEAEKIFEKIKALKLPGNAFNDIEFVESGVKQAYLEKRKKERNFGE